MIKSILELNFEVLKAADNFRYANLNDLRLVTSGPIAFCINYILTKCSGKRLEDISPPLIVSLRYIPLTSAKDSDDSFVGFDRDYGRSQRQLTENKKVKANIVLGLCLEIYSGLKIIEKAEFGPDCKVVVPGNIDQVVLDKVRGIDKVKIKNNIIPCYVPHCTPSLIQQALLTKQMLSKAPQELQYVERSVLTTDVNDHS